MKAHIANLINSLALILLGATGYFLSASASPTALIPVIGGIILLVLTPALKAEKKHQAHAAAMVTLLMFLALWMPLMGAFGRDDMAAVVRVGIMQLTGILALVSFIKSFRDARKKRASEA